MHNVLVNSILKKAGFTARETAVYLAGIMIGRSPASSIARKAGLSRTLTYHILQKLEAKGMVSKTGVQHGRMYTMEPITRLQQVFKHKRQELEEIEVSLEQAAVAMQHMQHQNQSPARVRFYTGIEGLKTVAQDILNTKEKMVRALVPSHKKIFETLDRSFVDFWMRDRERRGVESKSIWSGKIDPGIADSSLRSLRFARKGVEFAATVVIYDAKVAVISSIREGAAAWIVESKEYAQTMVTLFEEMWRASKR